ncbi:MAG: hypothetical protein ACP5UN_01310 [Candidatus Micrarchaeia archaeon]
MINNTIINQKKNDSNTIIEKIYNALKITDNESKKIEVYKILENADKEESIALFEEFKRKSGKELIIPYIIKNKTEFFLVPCKNKKHYRRDFVAFAIINDMDKEAYAVFRTFSEIEKKYFKDSWKSNHKVSEKLKEMKLEILKSETEINTFENLLYNVLFPYATFKAVHDENKIKEIILNIPSAEIIKAFKYSIDLEKRWNQRLSNANFNAIKTILKFRLDDLVNAAYSENELMNEIIYYSVRYNFKRGMKVCINKSQDLFKDFENIERSNIKIKNKVNFYNLFFNEYKKNKIFNEHINKLGNDEKCLVLEIACILNEKDIIKELSKDILIGENFNINVYKKYYAYRDAYKNSRKSKIANDKEIKENLRIIKLNKILRRQTE